MSTLKAQLWLPRAPEEIFPFFANAHNLETITPPWLRFSLAGPGPSEIRAGAIIDYRLRVHGLPLRWRTEITLWEPSFRFRDEQRKGPYRQWVHTHTFLRQEGGTLCLDEVEFQVFGGRLIERLFVQRDVRTIFEYRQNALYRWFAEPSFERAGHYGVPWRVTLEEGPASHSSRSATPFPPRPAI